ncbi:MAG: nucleosidase [Nitriliruptoraceae bacterium]
MSVLVVAALEEETRAFDGHLEVLHTGVGKVQAAAALAARLAHDPAELVVSVGTAGGLQGQAIGTVVEVGRVHQHDFDHAGVSRFVGRPLPGGPLAVDGPEGAAGRLATGDRLITSAADRDRLARHADVVDMEGYAVAATARAFSRQVWIAKAVSDRAGEDVAVEWPEALARCSAALLAWVEARGLLG